MFLSVKENFTERTEREEYALLTITASGNRSLLNTMQKPWRVSAQKCYLPGSKVSIKLMNNPAVNKLATAE